MAGGQALLRTGDYGAGHYFKWEADLQTEYIRLSSLTKQERKSVFERAGEIIRAGGLVAFPTETVYGLGADALNEKAAAAIYSAKGRPSDNPLIVHVDRIEMVEEIADRVSHRARRLMEAFWPGPLTVILPKGKNVPFATTGGLSTVAIRMPDHEVALSLIAGSRRPIAAPSANLSGRPSPTSAKHGLCDMDSRIPMILDGGPVRIGIESTIVDLTTDRPAILRPGFISAGPIGEIIGPVEIDPAVKLREKRDDIKARAPGMKYRHYAPRGQMVLVEGEPGAVVPAIEALTGKRQQEGKKVGVIASDETAASYHADVVRSIGSRKDPEAIASSLYGILREMDDQACEYIYSESFFSDGLGNAIMNRMLKAAGYHLITLEEGEDFAL